MAVGLAVVLLQSQCLPAALTAQAWLVPVLVETHHFLSKADPLVAARTNVGFLGERGDARGFAGPLWGATRFALLGSGHGDLDGASDLQSHFRGLLVDAGASTSAVPTVWLAGLWQNGFRLCLAWPPGISVVPQRSHLRRNLCQSLPGKLTFSAKYPALSHLGRLGGHGRCTGSARALHPRPRQLPSGCEF